MYPEKIRIKNLFRHLPVAAIACATLASCGGGGGDVGTFSTQAAATFGDCFELTPGVKFVKSNPINYKELVVQETFEGQTAFGSAELRPNDTRFGTRYQSISGGYIHFLGVEQYDGSGVHDGKNVYSGGYQLPVDMAPGQTVSVIYDETATHDVPFSVTVTNHTDQITFVGFEDLTLGGRTFTNACKIRMPGATAGQTEVSWTAKGFGVIKSETRDALDVLVPGSGFELTSIISAG